MSKIYHGIDSRSPPICDYIVIDLPKDFVATPRSQRLGDFSNIDVEMVRGGGREGFYNALIDAYHYLGYHQGTGEQLKYIIWDDGHVLACIGFGGAAFKSAAPDRHIGWTRAARERHLVNVANNNRLLILPWIRVPHLASHLSGRLSRRIRRGWWVQYKRDIVYWIPLSNKVDSKAHVTKRPTGFMSVKRRVETEMIAKARKVPIKDIYIYPFDRYYKELLPEGQMSTRIIYPECVRKQEELFSIR